MKDEAMKGRLGEARGRKAVGKTRPREVFASLGLDL